MARKDDPKHPLVTTHCISNEHLNTLLSELLTEKRAFAVTYDSVAVIVSYTGPSKE